MLHWGVESKLQGPGDDVRLIACLLAFLVSWTAHAHASPARCLSAFLSTEGNWQALTFDGRALDGGAFVPIQALFVRGGHVHAKLWQSDPTSARIKSAEDAILLKLFYPVLFPGTPDVREAARLQPYAQSEHRLLIPGACKSPKEITVRIEGGGTVHSIRFVRVPTTRAEFLEPRNWDW